MRDAVAEGDLFGSGGAIVLAVSGGPDSMALWRVVRSLGSGPGEGLALVVAHLNHRLRGAASDRDALFVAASARADGVPCVLGEPRSRAAGGENVEGWARAARYAFLEEVRAAAGASAICVAHTRDDQAETVLLRLARGAGPGALAAMAPARGDRVVRPLLARSRAECRAYLAAYGGLSVHDSTNDDARRLRSRVRRAVLPALSEQLGVDASARLARLAGELRVESELAERYVSTLLPPPGAALSTAAVAAVGPGASRLVHAWLARAGLRASARQIAAVVRLARASRPSGAIDLARGARVVRCYGELAVARAATVAPPWRPIDLALPGTTELANGWRIRSEWVERAAAAVPSAPVGGLGVSVPAERLALPLRARPPRPGDRIRLARGHRKLSDVFIDARVPRATRSGLVVVASADDMVVWVPGVASRAWVEHGVGPRIALSATRDGAGAT
ncbi:MAG TPA: tRNA lysidine(34) synthetase TilS [Candidatus Binatia bacterium]|nr:tRNA lysidine(34) synthetase TilS [Candidatus Binatia bacterium]